MSITFINVYNILFNLIFLCNSSIDIDDIDTRCSIYFAHRYFYSRYVSIWYIDFFGSYRLHLRYGGHFHKAHMRFMESSQTEGSLKGFL